MPSYRGYRLSGPCHWNTISEGRSNSPLHLDGEISWPNYHGSHNQMPRKGHRILLYNSIPHQICVLSSQLQIASCFFYIKILHWKHRHHKVFSSNIIIREWYSNRSESGGVSFATSRINLLCFMKTGNLFYIGISNILRDIPLKRTIRLEKDDFKSNFLVISVYRLNTMP